MKQHIGILVNGRSREVERGCDLATLLDRLGYQGAVIAVAVDQNVVPRGQYSGFKLLEGAHVEIVAPMAGG